MKPPATFEVRLHPGAVGVLNGLDPKTRERIREALERLAEEPFRPWSGADILKLRGVRGGPDLYRLRVGKHRAVYAVEGRTVWVTEIFERGRGYRGV